MRLKIVYNGDNGAEPFVIAFPHRDILNDWRKEIVKRQPSRYRDIPLLGAPPPYAIGSTHQTSSDYSHLVAPEMQRHTPLSSPALPLYTPSLLAPLDTQTANPFDSLQSTHPCRPSLVSAISASSIDECCLAIGDMNEKPGSSRPANENSTQLCRSPSLHNKRRARRAMAGVFILLVGGTFAHFGLSGNYVHEHMESTAAFIQAS